MSSRRQETPAYIVADTMAIRDYGSMLLIAAIWSGTWVVGKVGVTESPPFALSIVRFALAAVMLAILVRATGGRIPWVRWRALAALGVFGIVGQAVQFAVLPRVPASDAGFIAPSVTPIAAVILGAVFANQHIRMRMRAGLMAGTAGVALIAMSPAPTSVEADARLTADAIIALGAIGFAMYTVLGAVILKDERPIDVIAGATTIGCFLLIPFVLVEGRFDSILIWSPTIWAAIAYLSILVSVVAYFAFFRLVVDVGPARASIASYLVPIGTLGLSIAILAETPSIFQILGGGMAMLGVWLAASGDQPSPATEP